MSEEIVSLMNEPLRSEIKGLLAYAEDQAGGLMSPRYARLRRNMTVDEAFSYLRRDARDRQKKFYYAFVVDPRERLLGVVSFRDLFSARGDQSIESVMRTDTVTARDNMDQEALSDLFARHNLMMIPIVHAERRIKGIVTHDDIIDVLREEATEDIQKIGRYPSSRRAVSADPVDADDQKTRRMACSSVYWGNAHGHGDGLLRRSDFASRCPCSVRSVDYQ
jgi:magnesium transporter